MLNLGLNLNSRKNSSVSIPFSPQKILYVGRENNNQDSDYAVVNWSVASVPKKYVPGNQYGRSGYYQIKPMPSNASTSFTAIVGNNNNLGTTDASNPTLFSKPAFANVLGGGGTFVNYDGYPLFRGVDGIAIYRQGAISVLLDQGPYTSPAGENASRAGVPFTITMTQDATFLLGVCVDAVSNLTYAPRYVSVFHSSTGTIFSEEIPAINSIPRLALFLIQGYVGDVFSIGLWKNPVSGQSSFDTASVSLITFDQA